jgi:hypothetical protein
MNRRTQVKKTSRHLKDRTFHNFPFPPIIPNHSTWMRSAIHFRRWVLRSPLTREPHRERKAFNKKSTALSLRQRGKGIVGRLGEPRRKGGLCNGLHLGSLAVGKVDGSGSRKRLGRFGRSSVFSQNRLVIRRG